MKKSVSLMSLLLALVLYSTSSWALETPVGQRWDVSTMVTYTEEIPALAEYDFDKTDVDGIGYWAKVYVPALNGNNISTLQVVLESDKGTKNLTGSGEVEINLEKKTVSFQFAYRVLDSPEPQETEVLKGKYHISLIQVKKLRR